MRPVSRVARAFAFTAVLLSLSACSSGPKKVQPADLGADPGLFTAKTLWTTRVGAATPLGAETAVNGSAVAVASEDGTVMRLDNRSGQSLWRATVGEPLATGVGGNGELFAVVTQRNNLVAINSGKEVWRQKLPAQSYAAPLVSGGRVFVLTADRAVIAFDANNGSKLWTQQRPSDPLVLRQAGALLMAADGSLLVGVSGRLISLNVDDGSVRWEAPIATVRGTNEIERLADVVNRAHRTGQVVCARAFQANVGCVHTERGIVIWSKPADSATGVDGDSGLVVGVESDGQVIAWVRNTGERAWVSDVLRYRELTAPLMVAGAVVLGDATTGQVFVLSRQNGKLLARGMTDSSGVSSTPTLLEADTALLTTRSGNAYAIQFTPR